LDYISTKELAKKWQIDTSRVVRLAKTGRIPGAVLIGNTWMFPADTERLPDNRRKENKHSPAPQPFRFPLYFYVRGTEKMLSRFSPDERTLYDAEQAYTGGRYAACCETLNKTAARTTDKTVRIGALYVMCMSYLYMRQFSKATLCFREIQDLLGKDIPHKRELSLLLHDLESYFAGNSYYFGDLSLDFETAHMSQLQDYYMLQIAFADIIKAYFKDIPVNTLPYELYFRSEEGSLTPYSSALLCLYISMLCHYSKQKEKALEYLQRSCRISEDNRIERAIAFALRYLPGLFHDALKDTNPGQLARLTELADEETRLFNDLHEAMGITNILEQVDERDAIFIGFARRGFTNKEIGAILGLSENTVRKKYSAIFDKTGIHSKKMLVRLYNMAMENYNTEG